MTIAHAHQDRAKTGEPPERPAALLIDAFFSPDALAALLAHGEGDITTPFGGYKQSGFGGRDKGIEAFDQYTEVKTTWIALQGRP